MKLRFLVLAGAAAVLWAQGAAAGTTLSVPGTADPFLSGMPSGTTCCSGDSAPAESPLYAGAITAGGAYTFTSVSGSVSYAGGTPTDPPDGESGYLIDTADYEGGLTVIDGIAGYNNMPVDALVGVFLGPAAPNLIATPPSDLDFGAASLTTGFSSLSPGLQQIFFIGDGLTGTGSGSVQSFIAPAGATRLYLGVADGYGWYNNTGAISVTVNKLSAGVPEPDTWVMLLLGAGGVGAALRSARRKTVAPIAAA